MTRVQEAAVITRQTYIKSNAQTDTYTRTRVWVPTETHRDILRLTEYQ